jgi:hypothetical protein
MLAALRPRGRVLAVAYCGAVIAGGLVREAQRMPPRFHDPGYRVVARALEPWLRDAPPDQVSYLAPEAPAFGYYLFRTGMYWGWPYELSADERRARNASDPRLRAFVIDPDERLYGGWADSVTLAWLETSMVEITSRIERDAGRPIAMRVFVRPGQGNR